MIITTKHGKFYCELKNNIKCDNCGCEFTFSDSGEDCDIKEEYGKDLNGFFLMNRYINCPECFNKIILKEKKKIKK